MTVSPLAKQWGGSHLLGSSPEGPALYTLELRFLRYSSHQDGTLAIGKLSFEFTDAMVSEYCVPLVREGNELGKVLMIVSCSACQP